jgi:hypothetical protein
MPRKPILIRRILKEVDAKIDHPNQFKRFMQKVSKSPEMLLDPACDAVGKNR